MPTAETLTDVLAMPRRAYSYKRVSDPKQLKGEGLDRQADFAARLCARHGWQLDDTLAFADRGRSGFHGDHRKGRGQLLQFLQAVKSGRITPGSVLIIENLDRLSREEMDEAHDLFKGILRAGVWIATETPERVYTREDLKSLVGTIEPLLQMYANHEFSQKLSVRIKDKWERRRQRARAGQPHGRRCHAWLELTAAGYSLLPGPADTIRAIFRLAREGMGVQRIVGWLNERPGEYPPFGRAGRWLRPYVRQMLRGRAVLGEYQPRRGRSGRDMVDEGDPIAGYYPAVVTEQDWQLAQAALDGRRRRGGRPGVNEANLFTGIVHEATTGQRMSIDGRSPAGGGAARYLVVYGLGTSCRQGRGMPYQTFEDAVLRRVGELRPADVLPPGRDADAAERRMAELQARLTVLDRRLESGGRELDEEEDREAREQIRASLRRIGEEKAGAAKELKALELETSAGGGRSLGEAQSLLKMLDDADPAELPDLRRRLKAALRWVVKEIWVVMQPIHGRAALAHLQIYLRSGTRRPLQIVPVGKYGRLPAGFVPWDLGACDFRAGDVGDVARDAQPTSQLVG